jgi:hypothetical protein
MPLHPRWSASASLADGKQADWHRLTAAQAGVLDIEQLTELGINSRTIAENVAAGRWQRVLPRVYATFTGVLPRAARLVAALRYGGPFAILSHRTAAEEWGMVPQTDAPVDVTVPYQCSAVAQPPLVSVHRSRAIRHIVVASDPPRTSRADTILDLAVSAPSEREAGELLIDLVGRTSVSFVDIQRRMEMRPPYRYWRALRDAVDHVGGGLMSMLEVEYAEHVEVAHGIPQARRQTPVVVDGRVLWEDATYDGLGVPLTVRLDGRRFHSAPGVAFRDRRRDNIAELAGRNRLVYGWHDVHTDPCGVAREVATVLTRGGWPGRTHRCPRECVATF